MIVNISCASVTYPQHDQETNTICQHFLSISYVNILLPRYNSALCVFVSTMREEGLTKEQEESSEIGVVDHSR